jgi:hypothetical protein
VYGSVRTVVWQGSVVDRRPYADLTGKPEVVRLGRKLALYVPDGMVDVNRRYHKLALFLRQGSAPNSC